MQRYKVVTITHKTATVSKLKDYLLSDSDTSDFPANRLAELKSKLTDCLAKDNCGIPPEKLKVKIGEWKPKETSCCTPDSGCC